MHKDISIKLLPSEANDPSLIKEYLASAASVQPSAITGFYLLRRSVDARGRQPHIQLTVRTFINEPFHEREIITPHWRDVSKARRSVVIIGAGPAGLFAALKLIEAGIRPVILERGKDVRARRRDLAILNKEGELNPESNYCFGEGGAGTYSDGKLYTRSSKRGDLRRILELFVYFGAEENILYETHPHIGTNKLPQIITSIRKCILDCGGLFLFERRVTDLEFSGNKLNAVFTADGERYRADAFILATGHSARDIFHLFNDRKLLIEPKSFALGVRVEHPQSLIDAAQYHCSKRDPNLPPASYSVVEQVNGKGVFSFCMCPGGIIAPASTSPNELVVNGWSPSKRNNPYANSGVVVAVEEKELKNYQRFGTLAAMEFQRHVEQKAFEYGGGKFVAPAQRLADFTNGKTSMSLPECSYLPGIRSVSLKEVLPPFIYNRLKIAFLEFRNKIRGYYSNEAVVVATESRTSSPVRIPRHPLLMNHPQLANLYPCGEGAGYAGGIVSAAMDGERVASAINGFLASVHRI